ncbi:hypothetical protein [Companilactobacillus ginsenosidimutans]|uniref:IpaB/EvcA family protein n=1 Tax=Companilactobacillus ginsenosidimutans TaxID=1007676 RepID=A0A0H4QJ69_9LACO|nr:hypothetical protein [Companilactobacillus ginsenosidimutans]AKP67091.1 hypothetical protein ABM34_05755 [Companilactobacillus ginsenosidimutans]
MEKINKNDLSDNIVEQINQIEQTSHKTVEVFSDFQDQSILTLDQANHTIDDKTIKVEITNEQFASFVLLHELYHIQLEISDEPSISVSVTSEKPDVDGRILSTANSIFETLEHSLIIKKQIADGSFNDEVKTEYLKGIEKTLNPNVEIDAANMTFFRSLILFDAVIFADKRDDSEWKEEYRDSFKFVTKAVEIADKNDLTVPFQFRRALVSILEAYNDVIISHGYEGMNYHDFLSITPVVSNHQLRLALNQVYQIKHSSFKMRDTHQDAFTLIAINDGQSVAALGFDVDKVTPDFYKEFYQQTVQETFEANNINYLIR